MKEEIEEIEILRLYVKLFLLANSNPEEYEEILNTLTEDRTIETVCHFSTLLNVL